MLILTCKGLIAHRLTCFGSDFHCKYSVCHEPKQNCHLKISVCEGCEELTAPEQTLSVHLEWDNHEYCFCTLLKKRAH